MSTTTVVQSTTTPGTYVGIFAEKGGLETSHNSTSSSRFSWQKGPMPLITTPMSQTSSTDPYTSVASEMALVHNCIIRALNSIYIQAPHVPASEHSNFVNYSLSTYQGLCAHHDGEEHTFFPEIERITGEKGLMEVNVQGHRDFDTFFGEWGAWLESISKGERQFEAQTCIAMMDAFMPPLAAHLADEIPTLLALSRFGDKLDLLDLSKKEGEQVMGGLSKTTQLPLFFVNHDVTFEGGWHNFPPLPLPVKWVLREMFGRWQSQWWKFSTCGFDGQPRELRYLGEPTP